MTASRCACFLLAFVFPSAPGYPTHSMTNALFVSSRRLEVPAAETRRRRRYADKLVTAVPSTRDSDVFFTNEPRERASSVVLFNNIRGGATADDSIKDYEGEEGAHARGISLSLFLTYLTVMGAKCALPSTLAMLTSATSGLVHRSVALSRQDVMSRLLAVSTMSIAAGKFLLGPVIDRLGGVASLQIALSTLGICLTSIGFGATCPTLVAMASYWIVVDFAFSSCWAACVRTIRDTMPEHRWAREIGQLAVAARSGNAISFAFFAWLLQWASAGAVQSSASGSVDASWRWIFRASGAVQLIPLAMLSYFGAKGGRSSNVAGEVEQCKRKSTLKDSLAILFREGRTPEFWLHLLSRSIIMVLVSFLLFIPSYMAQCFEMSSASSARVGSIFALGCLLSVSMLAERTYPSVSARSGETGSMPIHRQKAYAMLAFLAVATACLALQSAFLRNIIGLSSTQGTMLMFLFGFSLSIPFYLPSSMFALKCGGEDGSATIADAFDVCGFGLLTPFNGYVAQVLDVSSVEAAGSLAMLINRKRAWRPVFSVMCGGSVTAMATLFGAVWLEGQRDKRNELSR